MSRAASNDPWPTQHTVVDQYRRPVLWLVPLDVAALSFHVSPHGVVVGVGIGAVAYCHPARRFRELRGKEDSEVPRLDQFVAVQEDAVDDEYGIGFGGLVGRVQGGIGRVVVSNGTKRRDPFGAKGSNTSARKRS